MPLTSKGGPYGVPSFPSIGSPTFQFQLPVPGEVEIDIFDLAGRRVRRIVGNRNAPAGLHAVLWDGRNERGVPAAASRHALMALCIALDAALLSSSPSHSTPPTSPDYPELLHKQEPVYPNEAREAGEHGIVGVRCLVDSTGKVVEAHVIRKEGQHPRPLIEAAAIEAAFKSRFKLASASWIALPFAFSPNITVDLVSSSTDFAVSDSVSVTATIASDVRIDSLITEISFPSDPYGIHAIMPNGNVFPLRVIGRPGMGFAASVARRSWSINLHPGRPVRLHATFAATSCGRSDIRVHCMSTKSNIAAERSLSVCIRGDVGNHLPEYRTPARTDSIKQAMRVDDRVLAQQTDSCCSSNR